MAGQHDGRATPVSIVLYVHDGEPYLDGAIDAIRAQTHERFELCVVDDGSTDGTTERLVELALVDDRIRLQHQEARGRQRLHETVNVGLAMARHDLIAMANADDLWHPEKLARQVAAFAHDPQLDVCTHDAVFIDDRGRVKHGGFRRYATPYSGPPPRPWQFIAGNPIPNPTTVFRRGILRRIGLQEVGDMHDHQFWFKATIHGCRFLDLPDRLIRYRVHEGSHSTARSRREIIARTHRESSIAVVDRYGLDRLFPELVIAGDAASRAWAASFAASEFWRTEATEAAERYWRLALRHSDDAAILIGLGMCRLRDGDEAAALELLQRAAASGSGDARFIASGARPVDELVAPIWVGPEPPIAEVVRATDERGFDLGTDTSPPRFDRVVTVGACSGDADLVRETVADSFVGAAVDAACDRVLFILETDGQIAPVEAAHASAASREPSVLDLQVEVDIAPATEHPARLAALRLDGTAIQSIDGRVDAVMAA